MRNILLLGVVTMTFSFAACGGKTVKTVSQSEWTQEADKICKKYADKADQLKVPQLTDPSKLPTGLVDFMQQRLDLLHGELKELRAIGTIKSGTTNTQKNDLLDGVGLLEQKSAKALEIAKKSKTLADMQSANQLGIDSLKQKLSTQAKGLGLKVCGSRGV